MTEDELQQEAIKGAAFMRTSASAVPLRVKLVLGAALATIIALACIAWWPAKPIHEVTTAAPEVRQGDGSLIASRAPDAHPTKPPHAIPRGYVEERRETVHVAPDPSKADVEIDLSLVRKGNERRVIASTPDGIIVSALDMPIEPELIPPPPKPWAAGVSYDTRHAVGLWLDRDIGRLVVGAAVARLPDGKAEAQVRVGVRF